jgi:hypothetical protein
VPTPGQRDVDSAVRRLDDILMTVFYLVAILIIVGMLDVAFNVSPYWLGPRRLIRIGRR